MIWTLLQIVTGLSLLAYQPDAAWMFVDQFFLASVIGFHLFWHGQSKWPEIRDLASLYFSSLLGFTALMCICDGPLLALGVFWPALMLRLREREAQRMWLALLQFLLALASAAFSHYLYVSAALALASLIQTTDSRPARWLNSAALTLCLGVLLEALFFPPDLAFPQLSGDPSKVVQGLFLLSLPQVGLRLLNKSELKAG